MQAVQQNPSLPGLAQSEAIVLSEKLYNIHTKGFKFCSERCISHYGEDSIPYHPGEKTCLDRCLEKVKQGINMAIETKKTFEMDIKKGKFAYNWMKTGPQLS